MTDIVTDPASADLPVTTPETTALDPSAVVAPADASQQDDKTPPPHDDKEGRKVANIVQKRIDEITRQRHESEKAANEQIQHWQRQAWELHQRNQQLEAASQKLQLDTSKPTLEGSGNDFEKFLGATAAWEAQKNAQALQAQFAQTQQQRDQQAAQQAQQYAMQQQAQQQFLAEQQFVKAKIVEGSKTYKDFEAVISNPELPPLRQINPAAYQAILQSEKGIDVAYYIAKNPLLAVKIATAPPMQAVLEIGRIEGMFQAGKRVSDAPAPPAQSLSGNSSSGGSDALSDRMSMDEWVAKRNKQIRARH